MPAFSHQSANQLATAQRRAVMAFSRATRGQRAVAFMFYFYGCPSAREIYGKKSQYILRNLGLRAETSYAPPLAHCRALIMYENVNNAPPGSRKARARSIFFALLSS